MGSHGSPHGASRNRRRHGWMGRGVRPFRQCGYLRDPDFLGRTLVHRQGTRRHCGVDGTGTTDLPQFWAYRARVVRLVAIDIALWDIAAKRSGQPVYRMLGGTGGELQLYASLMKYGEVDAIRRNVQRAYQAGFRMIKLHEATIPDF